MWLCDYHQTRVWIVCANEEDIPRPHLHGGCTTGNQNSWQSETVYTPSETKCITCASLKKGMAVGV